MSAIRSRANPRVRRWRALAADARARRREGCALIEGPRLVAEYLERIGAPAALLVGESRLREPRIAKLAARQASVGLHVLPDALLGYVCDVETPAGIAAEIRIPGARGRLPESPGCVFLEGIQDAGNLGAILRSAAAFGIRDAVLAKGGADPWSPKVLRAAMGAHFMMSIAEVADLGAALERFGGMTIAAVAAGGTRPQNLDLSGRVGWVFGREGGGLSEALARRCAARCTIEMPGGSESLNVAAAAAILFYERSAQLSRHGARSGAPA